MKLAIINVTAGGISGGYKKYLENIIPRLIDCELIDSLLVVSPDSIAGMLSLEDKNGVRSIKYQPQRLMPNNLDRQTRKTVKEFEPDALFLPVARPIRLHGVNARVICMIRNMEPFVQVSSENSILEKLRLSKLASYGAKSLKEADAVIAVSRFVKDYMTQVLCIDEKKVFVIYPGVDIPIMLINRTALDIDLPILENEPFVFSAGIINPARGLEDLIEAAAILKRKGQLTCKIAIAGEIYLRASRYRKKLDEFISRFGLEGDILWLGKITGEQMSWCYVNSKMIVMTSRVEASPNIALEAMSHGCIIIAADNPPLPEFFGECAYYYSPGNANKLADIIRIILTLDEKTRRELQGKSRKRAMEFSWGESCRKTVKVLFDSSRIQTE